MKHSFAWALLEFFPSITYDVSEAVPYTRRLVFLHKNTGRLVRRSAASGSIVLDSCREPQTHAKLARIVCCSGPRLALVVGFGGLLSIMALAGIDALSVLQQFRRNDDQIRRRYLARNHVLNDIRSDVYVSGTYVRDYLLEPDPHRADTYRTSLEDVRRHMESSLQSYRREVAPAEAQHYSALRAELLDYWGILDSDLPMGPCGKAQFWIRIFAR